MLLGSECRLLGSGCRLLGSECEHPYRLLGVPVLERDWVVIRRRRRRCGLGERVRSKHGGVDGIARMALVVVERAPVV